MTKYAGLYYNTGLKLGVTQRQLAACQQERDGLTCQLSRYIRELESTEAKLADEKDDHADVVGDLIEVKAERDDLKATLAAVEAVVRRYGYRNMHWDELTPFAQEIQNALDTTPKPEHSVEHDRCGNELRGRWY